MAVNKMLILIDFEHLQTILLSVADARIRLSPQSTVDITTTK